MPYIIVPADLKTHMYGEIITEITRADATITQDAIDTAIAEAKSYCSRYNLDAIFGVAGAGAAATVSDPNLKSKVKDLICWHLIRLANPNIDLALFKTAYDDAIAWFTKIMRGQLNPAGWTYRDTSTDAALPEGNSIGWSSNTKRSNHY